jgi:hypothetical protein
VSGGQAPQDTPAWEELAARKSQRGALITAGALATTGVALGVLAAVILVVSLAHSSSARQMTKQPRQPPATYLAENQLQPGDCLIGSNMGLGTDNTWPDAVAAVSCTQPHLAEVYYVGNPWPESLATYPGDNAILKIVDERCSAAFAAYDGIHFSQSMFIYHSVAPTPASDWATGDREVVCMAFDPNQIQGLRYSIKGKDQ